MKENEIQRNHRIAMDNSELAIIALRNGDISKFRELSAEALKYEKKAAVGLYDHQIEPTRSVLFRSASYIALDNADFIEAQNLYASALDGDVPVEIAEELEELKTHIDRIKVLNEDFIQYVIISLKSKPEINGDIIKKEIERILKSFEAREINMPYVTSIIQRQFNIESDTHTTIESSRYKTWLYDKKGSVDKRYWERYAKFLLNDEKWAPDTINKLDNITNDILDHLKDPKSPGDWDRRGMVVGQVQSGKTSNYLGLVCKAADYGYRIIIVLAGLSKDLRSQTQFRVDEGFLGWDTKIERSLKRGVTLFGVSKYDNRPKAHYLTSSSLDGDFSSTVTYSAGTNIMGSDPVVMVVKKNGSVLKELTKWLANQGTQLGDGKKLIKKTPVLIIDDEADNASINISAKSISTINGLIRSLLSLFQQSSYVGYTATPFANVFIPPNKSEDKLSRGLNILLDDFWKYSGEDLFPRDFILNIPPPTNYMGPKEVFGIDSEISVAKKEKAGLPIIREIEPEEYLQYFPEKHKKDDSPPQSLPESLCEAIKSFILTCAIRRVRGDIQKHNSMLIHVTQFVNWQNKIATLVDKQFKLYQRQIQYKQGKIISDLKTIYEKEYSQVTTQFLNDERFIDSRVRIHDWTDIEMQLNKAASKIVVRAIHGDSTQENLGFENINALDYHDNKNGLSVIAVGGNKLSRGLTLYGLSVSYYIRPSKMYDTLMQMGRWFGYHSGYNDLCRLYTTPELVKWYKYITVASEELREDFDEMKSLRKSPLDFGIKVREHPDALLITAPAKMRSGTVMELTFSDKLRETWCFSRDKKIINKNYKHTYKFINALSKQETRNGQKYTWYAKNNFEYVIQFLKGYIADNVIEHGKIIEYIEAQSKKGFLKNWTIVLISNERNKKNNLFKVNNKAISVGLTMRSDEEEGRGHYYEISRSHIIDPRHEFVDFNIKSQPYKDALKQTVKDWEDSTRRNKSDEEPEIPTGRNIRAKRNVSEGLLLIYPLDPKPKGWTNSGINEPIIGYAISFPKNSKDHKIEYKVNEVFKEQNEVDQVDEDDIE